MYLNKAKMIALLNDIETTAKEAREKLIAVPGFHPVNASSVIYLKVKELQELASPTQPNPYDEEHGGTPTL